MFRRFRAWVWAKLHPYQCRRCSRLLRRVVPRDLDAATAEMHCRAGTLYTLYAYGFKCPAGCDPDHVTLIG